MAAMNCAWKLPKSAALPVINRASSIEVCTVTSLCASLRQVLTVRTLEPISRPASQQLPINPSMRVFSSALFSADWSSGSSSSTSTSECGNNSRRPNPPTAAKANGSLRPARCQSTLSRPSASPARLCSAACTPRVEAPLAARALSRVALSARYWARRALSSVMVGCLWWWV